MNTSIALQYKIIIVAEMVNVFACVYSAAIPYSSIMQYDAII